MSVPQKVDKKLFEALTYIGDVYLSSMSSYF